MPKDAFYQAVVGDFRFDGVLSADGPYIMVHSVADNRPAGGVAWVASGLRRFVPSQFGMGPIRPVTGGVLVSDTCRRTSSPTWASTPDRRTPA